MRKRIIAGNWKMNKTSPEAVNLANAIKRDLADVEGVETVLCPTFVSLGDVRDVIVESNIKLGAQDVY
jgi:triosephosphate isomerase